MKTFTRTVAAVFLCLTFTRCIDELAMTNIYLGDWDFVYYYSMKELPHDTTFYDTTIYRGVIRQGPGEDELFIQYTETQNIIIRVDKDGIMLDYCFSPSMCSGRFTDRNSFTYSYSARISSGPTMRIYSKRIEGKRVP